MLSAASIRQMIDRVAAEFHPRRVVLFGSYATGMAQEESDVDLLVVTDSSSARDTALAIRRSLADFPVACDVIVRTLPDYERQRQVVNHIVYFADKYGRVVYEQ